MSELSTIKNLPSTFDVETIRKDFPILNVSVKGKPLVYFDNGATAQKPTIVINTVKEYYETFNSNIHRGVHELSGKATEAYENARSTVQNFINAADSSEIVFTKGTTDAINLIAYSYGRKFINEGDEIIVTEMEHHSNIIPWQVLCKEQNAVLKVVSLTESGELDIEEYEKLLSAKTKLVALVHVSNVLGTINPVKEMIVQAHALNVPVLLDGAQAVPHMPVDVADLDCDFYTFSSHKLFGPMGIGVLYGKQQLLEQMPPYQTGGGMIKTVSFDEETEFSDSPFRFEAGTPDVGGVLGLEAAIGYVENIGYKSIADYEHELLEYGEELLADIEGVRIIGNAKNKATVISFLVGDIHPYDTGVILDQLGIAIRTGHHCCQPMMEKYQIEGTCRASLAFYNTKAELDKLAAGIHKVKSML